MAGLPLPYDDGHLQFCVSARYVMQPYDGQDVVCGVWTAHKRINAQWTLLAKGGVTVTSLPPTTTASSGRPTGSSG